MLSFAARRAAPMVANRAASTCRLLGTIKYTKKHEYANVEGKVAIVGVTDFAQAALGDVVYVDLPAVGSTVTAGESFGSVESVKAASDVFAPVSGTVTEINTKLSEEPGIINTGAESNGWFIKVAMSNPTEANGLLDAKAYKAHCESEAH